MWLLLSLVCNLKAPPANALNEDLDECQNRVPVMPNPWRAIAGGDEIIVIFLPIWVDDVSANKSKQYNKHINIYTQISNLPGRLLQQEYFVRFVSTSAYASSPEQLSAILARIKYVMAFVGNSS